MGTTFQSDRRMLVPKKDRLIIYRNLFKEGVMVAKKDLNKAQHDDPALPVKNIYVVKLLTSLKSRGYVTERFSWQWYYWSSTTRALSTSASTSTFLLRSSQTLSRSPPVQLSARASAHSVRARASGAVRATVTVVASKVARARAVASARAIKHLPASILVF